MFFLKLCLSMFSIARPKMYSTMIFGQKFLFSQNSDGSAYLFNREPIEACKPQYSKDSHLWINVWTSEQKSTQQLNSRLKRWEIAILK